MNTPMTNNSGPEPSHRGRPLPVDNSQKPTPRLPDPYHPIVPSLRYRITLAVLVLLVAAGLALILASG